ncbi:hypothetical protein HPP92_010962 [Vanilla planifolia]|uniref:Uncharacterized protein n=1 Tax=Vanilla planifolia TaxID=51239 RepID=A0A835R105_VANPL|nr:hypothetical protein HPP92_010962 [Vanilla planifolia]
MLNDHHGLCGAQLPTSPRISFSKDFTLKPPKPSSPTASDQDFEFGVGSRPMIAADELFFKGRMLPLLDPPQPPVSSRAVTPLD